MMAMLPKQIRFCVFTQDVPPGAGVSESEARVFSGELGFNHADTAGTRPVSIS